MSEPWELGLVELADRVGRGEFSCREVVASVLERIGAVDDGVAAFLSVRGDAALEQAERADRARARGEAGPLAGLPLAVKDIFVSPDFETTCASRILAQPSPPPGLLASFLKFASWTQ